MEPWFALLVLFSPWWWCTAVLACILVICALEANSGKFAFGTLFVWGMILSLFTQPSLITVAKANPTTLLYWFCGYLLGAPIYVLCKWYLFNQKRLHEYETEKYEWLSDGGLSGNNIPENLQTEWKKYLRDTKWMKTIGYDGENSKKILDVIPRARDYASEMLTWATYWPFSLFWSMFDDVIRNIFRFMNRQLTTFMDWIAKIVFRNIDQDFKP